MDGFLQDQLWIRTIPSLYSPSQVSQYLTAIGVLPAHSSSSSSISISISSSSSAGGRSFQLLGRIVKHHLLTFPFENTAMHYTAERCMDVSAEGLFTRLVLERKGSYCFGQNTLLLEMLRGLGFRAYSAAARVNQNWRDASKQPLYTSHSHMVILIQPFEADNRTYVVDVGFGGSGLVRPIPLVSGEPSVVMGVGPTEFHRLIRAPYSHSSLSLSLSGKDGSASGSPGQDVWNLEVRHGGKDTQRLPWKRMYSFCEHEFFATDCKDASTLVTTTIKLFTQNVLCIKYILDEDSPDGHLYRVILFGRQVKTHRNGETQILATLETDLDRLKVLREMFGIDIHDSAVEFVQGGPAQLK